MRTAIEKSALSRNTYGREYVITRDHHSPDVRIHKFFQNTCRRGFQLVLEYDETHKSEPTLDFAPGHLLCFMPSQIRQVSRSAANDPVALMGVV